MKSDNFVKYIDKGYSTLQTSMEAKAYREDLETRRSIRNFSTRTVEQSVITDILMTASSAPSGANKQPWTFCAIANKKLKTAIRKAAEEEEYTNYHGRMSDEWLADLKQFGTDWNKPFIEDAPWIIVVFKKSYDIEEDGEKSKNYYVNESVGIATGMLITAIHKAGLVTLTHTPSPMSFLHKLLNRPVNEKAYLLLPIGYPVEGEQVPVLDKKSLDDVVQFYL